MALAVGSKDAGLVGKGKRGVVYLDYFKGKKVVVKVARADSRAINKIEDEARWLKRLNNFGIGPKFIGYKDGKLTAEYIDGKFFLDWFKDASAVDRKKVVREVMNQCRIMDRLGISKCEMHRPVKHILISKGKAVMIDFERCKIDLKAKNVTQFGTFLQKLGVGDVGEVRVALRIYRRKFDDESFEMVLKALDI